MSEEDTSSAVDPVTFVPPSRKAADKANKIMHKMSQKRRQSSPQVDNTVAGNETINTADSTPSLVGPGVEQEGGADDAVSKETLKRLRETLSSEGVVACPKVLCLYVLGKNVHLSFFIL